MLKTWKLLPQVHSDLIRQLLHNRGLVTEQEVTQFLNPALSQLRDPFDQFPQLKKTLKRIQAAIEKKELVYIYGDYDVDGLTATAIMWENLRLKGANVLPYIPHREKEGYGLNQQALKKLKDEGAGLVISVDCGITAALEAKYALDSGLDLIITDHHRQPEVLPPAYAIVHTDQLCGAGIAFKIAYGLNPKTALGSLDLAALGTIADLQPLSKDNRVITKLGLEELRLNKRVGLRALYNETNLDPKKLKAWDVSFVIAPRLNAIGRLDHAIDGLRVLLTTNVERAYQIADRLKNANKRRQEFTSIAMEEARQMVAASAGSTAKVCLVVGESWKEGVIGLVAARLVEEVSLPVVAITKMDGYSKGSARSYNGFNIIEAISKVGHLLVGYGGHPGAAGFTLKTEKVEEFCASISQVMEETYTDAPAGPQLQIEAELKSADLDLKTVEKLSQFEPFGIANQEPLFLVKQINVKGMKTVGEGGKHLKLTIEKDGVSFDSIGFSLGTRQSEVSFDQPVDLVGTLKEDNWNFQRKLQFSFKDFRPSF